MCTPNAQQTVSGLGFMELALCGSKSMELLLITGLIFPIAQYGLGFPPIEPGAAAIKLEYGFGLAYPS